MVVLCTDFAFQRDGLRHEELQLTLHRGLED